MSSDERVTFLGGNQLADALWTPVPGRSVEELGRTLQDEGEIDASAFDSITDAAVRVLAQAAPPEGDRARRTGLVVGYVQSGKTLSMTTVAALARDNGYRIVIVFAGVTSILLSQTRARFQQHLQPAGQYPKQWRILDYERPAHLRAKSHELQNLVATWRNAGISDHRKPALLLSVMKNYRHLNALAQLLGAADLTGIPVLVIDDEADQAGLNTTPKKAQASSTHRHIAAVRRQLPHHTYLQYTATPQAPLLISLIDMLSPEFAEVLEAGSGYTGGDAFFRGNPGLVSSLPGDELFKPGDPPTSPPAGLIRALQQFFVAAGAFGVERLNGQRQASGPWSMLVHPSQRQADHGAYLRWIQQIQKQWRKDLELSGSDPDKAALVLEFRDAYDELATTDAALPPFADILGELPSLIAVETVITELNSAHGNEVPWKNAFAHVLVGGEKLNRGFTVKGLTTTYMPRGAGGWNADTIQQRARFFGYKAGYLGRCRVHLHPHVRTAYRDYVEHEGHVRRKLSEFRGRPLVEWKRAFFMDGAMRPTRANVLSDPYYKVRQRQQWFIQLSPHDEAIRDSNRGIATALIGGLHFTSYSTEGRHLTALVPVAELLGRLLVPFAVVGNHDIRWMYAVRVWLDALHEDDPSATARIVLMDGGRGDESARTRRRTAESGLIKQLPQGADPPSGYPGDREVTDSNRVTVQIHRLRVVEDGQTHQDVYALAVRIPRSLSSVLVQPGSA